MANTAILAIRIVGDSTSGVKALDQTADKSSRLGDVVKKTGAVVALGFAAAGAAAVKFGSDAIGAASDLNETLSKSRVIFGENAKAMEKWAAGAAKSAGLSKAAALDAAAGFGDMLQQLGMGGKDAAANSKWIVGLAADLGSFNNLQTDDVLDRISASLRGEFDSLQALIPNINAARVATVAMELTGKKTAATLTAQEKALATLNIIQKDGARAAGDFARTSSGLANQQKILGAEFENVKAKIGTALLPIATQLVSFLAQKFIPAVQTLAADFAKKFGPAIQAVGKFITGTLVPAAIQFHLWFVEKIAPGIKKAVTPVIEGLRSAFAKVQETVEKNRPELEKLGTVLRKVAEFVAAKVIPILGTLQGQTFKTLGAAISVVIQIVSTFVNIIDKAIAGVRKLIDLVKDIKLPDVTPGFNLPGVPGLRTASGVGVVPVPVTVNISVPGGFIGSDQQLAERLAPVFERAVQRRGRRFGS